MSDITNSPTPIVADSSKQFANEPLLALMKMPLHLMTMDQKRAYALEMRTLAKSPQALGRKLRQEAEEKVERQASSKAPKVSADMALAELMKEMGG